MNKRFITLETLRYILGIMAVLVIIITFISSCSLVPSIINLAEKTTVQSIDNLGRAVERVEEKANDTIRELDKKIERESKRVNNRLDKSIKAKTGDKKKQKVLQEKGQGNKKECKKITTLLGLKCKED